MTATQDEDTRVDEEIEKAKTPEIVEKFDGKTIRVSTEFQSRIYRISVEYATDLLLEVNLIPLAEDGTIASSTFNFHDKDPNEMRDYEDVHIAAIRKAKAIARSIEKELETDFDEDDV